MGYYLARHAALSTLPEYPQLSGNARATILTMCVLADDRDDDPAFKEDSAVLIHALGHPHETDYRNGKGAAKLKRARQELTFYGLIKFERMAGPFGIWHLTLPRWTPHRESKTKQQAQS